VRSNAPADERDSRRAFDRCGGLDSRGRRRPSTDPEFAAHMTGGGDALAEPSKASHRTVRQGAHGGAPAATA
jgi:hypothetical protein